MPPHLLGVKREWNSRPPRVPFEPPPMALVSERFALENPQRGEQSPPAQQPRLPGREAHLLDGDDAVVVEDHAVDHRNLMRGAGHAPPCHFNPSEVSKGPPRHVPLPS